MQYKGREIGGHVVGATDSADPVADVEEDGVAGNDADAGMLYVVVKDAEIRGNTPDIVVGVVA